MTNKTLEEIYIARNKFGNKLIVAAWFMVIGAAIIGLLVAWSMGLQAYEVYTENGVDLPTGKWFDIFLAGLPFVMVSSIELLKIPLVTKIYNSRRLILKFFYAIVLIGVTLITFETLAVGFERQYANRMAQIDIPIHKLNIINKKIELALKKKATDELILNQLSQLKKEQLRLEKEILNTSSHDQLYRLTRTIYGVEGGTLITEKQVGTVAKWWFGSLATIITSMGILLAGGGLTLKRKVVNQT